MQRSTLNAQHSTSKEAKDAGWRRQDFHPPFSMLHLLLIIAAFVVMLIWSWGAWPDPLVDFGTHLYVPWQLSVGKVLYRDVAYYNGPLSPYFNALMFKVFGVGLHVLEG